MSASEKGLVHLYVGNGKGKTTASIGLSVRAVGAGKRVLIAQFMKGRDSAEIAVLGKIGIDVLRTKQMTKFTFQMNEAELSLAKSDCEACLRAVDEAMQADRYDLVVLDEVVDAVNARMIDVDDLLAALRSRPEHIEVVMTGRNPGPELVDYTDYYTLMTAEKHPYDTGITARKGIEF